MNVGVPGCVCLTRETTRDSEGSREGADGAQWAPGAVQNLWCIGLALEDRYGLVGDHRQALTLIPEYSLVINSEVL